MRARRTAASGMAAQQLNVEVISNNIANMNTVGFKKQRAEFQDLLYQNVERMGAQSSSSGTVVPTGIQIGAGVKAGAVYRLTEQGTPQATGAKVRQGALEGSNVNPLIEITNLIEIQRAYESVTRMIENTNDLSRRAVERLGKV